MDGETIVTVVYALIGGTGALSVVVFGWGFVEYITKIGLPGDMRKPGVSIMLWGVRLVVTSVFLIVALKLVERFLN